MTSRFSDRLAESQQRERMQSEGKRCGICEEAESIYKCPRCGILTCSLQCCKEHKRKYECSGVRDRSQYHALGEFSESVLRNDYHFLEDVLQCKDRARRKVTHDLGGMRPSGSRKRKLGDVSEDSPQQPPHQMQQQDISAYPKHLQKLVRAAKEQDVTMLLLPQGMSRRNANTTHVTKEKLVLWKIQLNFHPRDGEGNVITHELDGIKAEESTLNDLLDQFFEPREGNSVIRHNLRLFRKERASLTFAMKVIPSPQLFVRVNPVDTVAATLRGKAVIEYPSIDIIMPTEVHRFKFLIQELTDVDAGPSTASGEEVTAGEEKAMDGLSSALAHPVPPLAGGIFIQEIEGTAEISR